ncbi:hypothetical protein ACA910_018408 [Epithemia clementina (nom. ined.)]
MEIAVIIGSGGFGLMVLLLVQATVAQGTPLEQLGKRPKGRGLWGYLYHGVLVSRVGTSGYDPILGSFSPLTRLLLHWSLILILWASALAWLERTVHVDDDDVLVVGSVGGMVALSYGIVCHVIHHMLPGVSQPGGPRPLKIRRYPQWSKGIRPAAPKQDSLMYAQASKSHKWTVEERFAGSKVALTGESIGRDVWKPLPTSSSKNDDSEVDEKVVQELASGGRPWGFDPSVNPNSADQIFRAQLIRTYLERNGGTKAASPSSKGIETNGSSVDAALRKAVHFYSMLQTDDGHWSGDYGGPLFLMPGLVVVWYVMGQPQLMLSQTEQELMKYYMISHQQCDGGWGTHIESPSTMFGTTLNYVALRLLGMQADHPVAQSGRAFLRQQGGALYTASWAKFYLCLLGCMEWEGHNSVPPEMWLLPNWFPFHPGRMWCHARMVYLPMGYLYGARFVYPQADKDPTVQALRKELYVEPYDKIPWIRTRNYVAPMDNYSPLPWTMAAIQYILARYEAWSIFQPFKKFVRKHGLKFSIEYMKAEDLQTNFIDIGPVNKVLNMLSAFHAAGNDLKNSDVVNHMARVADYLWLAEDGMKMKGYNGSQCWDTSFAIQAIHESGLVDDFPEVARKVWSFLERTQILSTEVSQATAAFEYESDDGRKKCYRHVSQGGWPFSTSAHGWPISDCTGEGLKGALCLLGSKAIQAGLKDGSLKPIDEKRLQNAANVLLLYQNEDGGWATYENNRGFGWYESLNPSEVFGDIMIDYSYVECSMASITGLVDFHETFPNHRTDEIQHAILKGRDFIKSLQRPNGSWYGSWACCFCYGAWFGVEGLVKSGEPITSDAIQKACQFLIRNQRANGGWGEDFTACFDKDYPKHGMKDYGDSGSGVVNTGWALLALSAAKYDNVEAIRRGVQYLLKRQLPSGDWPQEGIAGVFNRACGITYTAYRNVFPIWALGRCREVYGEKLKL